MKIGIDFGTTYTKIAYVDGQGNLKLFRYPDPTTGRDYIPTAVAYQQLGNIKTISLGDAARQSVINEPGVIFAENFKMLLPMKEQEQWKAQGWSLDKSPAEVTRDYFQELLRKTEYSFERVHGSIDSLVVSVPELWQHTANNPGAEALRRVLDELKLPVDRLMSEPICAAAYCVYEYRRAEMLPSPAGGEGPGVRGNTLLMCDMGGGTFDVALCRVTGQKIEVLDFDGSGHEGFNSAGVAFDREVVRTAYKAKHGADPKDDIEFVELLRTFEEVKITKHGDTSQIVELDMPADTPLYIFRRNYQIMLGQARDIFSPISQEISEVLGRIRKRAGDRGCTIDRVAIVGGFGQFPLVQQAILHGLEIHDANDVRFDTTLNREHRRFYAVAFGAALIANGLIETVEYYPHTLGIFVHRIKDGAMTQVFLPIVEAGKMPAGQEKPCMSPVKIRVEKQTFGPFPIRLKLHGTGELLALNIPASEYPEPGEYSIGVNIDRSNMGSLVFESVHGKVRKEYRLGNVNPELIVEEK